jgi:hypothetical protein
MHFIVVSGLAAASHLVEPFMTLALASLFASFYQGDVTLVPKFSLLDFTVRT